MSRQRVVVSGLGVVSPIGCSVSDVLNSVVGLRSGITVWESPMLSRPFPAGVVQQAFDGSFSRMELSYLDRCSQMALIAAGQAMADAGLSDLSDLGERAGVYYGTVRGGAATEESWVKEFHIDRKPARPFTMLASMLNAGAAQVSMKHRVMGPSMTYTCACASSGAAIGDAFRAIRNGDLDVAIVGGAEASLIPSIVAAWDGIRALAPVDGEDVGRSCKPFSAKRRGLVVSEGAAFLVLESEASARRRGVRGRCFVTGYGTASDAHHIGSPHSGGQVRAMMAALADSGLRAEDIGYVNAHATATQGGDPVEAESIRSVFGETTAVSSTKALHGHLLGAASAIELLITVLAVQDGFLPATAHLGNEDIDPLCRLGHVLGNTARANPKHAMSFSAGFGGTNVSLVVSAIDADTIADPLSPSRSQ